MRIKVSSCRMKDLIRKMSTAAPARAARLLAIALLAVAFGANAAVAQIKAYVTNAGNDTLSVIDVATHTVVGTIPVPGDPQFLVINAAGSRAYVTLSSGAVAVVDLATNSITTVPVGQVPIPLTLSGNGAFLYIGNTVDNTVSVIDTATNAVVTTLTLGDSPVGMATTADGASVWVADGAGIITVIDTATNTITSTFDSSPPGQPGSVVAANIVFTPDGAFAYLANTNDTNCPVIATATRTIVATIPTESEANFNAITPGGAAVYQPNTFSNSVSVIDTSTNTVAATVPVGLSPRGVAITPDGAFAYVANAFGNTVSVIATATHTVVATVPVGTFPVSVAITGMAEVPPVLTADHATVTVTEGQTAANTGTVTDANHDTVTLTASVGTVVNHGDGAWSWSFATTHGPAQSQTVTITGNDGHGGVSSTTFSLTVLADTDHDGIPDNVDNCPLVANPTQADFDHDGIGDACDGDIDNDGKPNASDLCDFTPAGVPVGKLTGCSIAELCPCIGPFGTSQHWHDHFEYVTCVTVTATTFLLEGSITSTQEIQIIAAANQSSCGR